MQKSGLSSYRAIAGALNARGIITARDGAWHATTVRLTLRHSGTQRLAMGRPSARASLRLGAGSGWLLFVYGTHHLLRFVHHRKLRVL